jgi:hypothetical protein
MTDIVIDTPPGYLPERARAGVCRTLQAVIGRPGGIVGLSQEDYLMWSYAMRSHRQAWLEYVTRGAEGAQSAYDRAEAQGRLAGWWQGAPIPYTATIPILTARESAEALLAELDPADARQWAWNLARAVRDRTRT